jgi:hypothetical protein
MSQLVSASQRPTAQHVEVTDNELVITLTDGRCIAGPLAWYPRLLHGTPTERNHWKLIARGEGIHWPDLDEDLSVEGVVMGRPSGESQTSFERWLSRRAAQPLQS